MDRLMAISPVDGRYGERVAELVPFFSEFGLIRYRVLVEIEYFIALSHAGLPQFEGFPAKRKRSCWLYGTHSLRLTLTLSR